MQAILPLIPWTLALDNNTPRLLVPSAAVAHVPDNGAEMAGTVMAATINIADTLSRKLLCLIIATFSICELIFHNITALWPVWSMNR
jgi:hypothetical protein